MPITFKYEPPKRNAVALLAAAKVAGETAGAHVLLAESQPLVPVESGTLLGTGRVEHQGTAGAAVIYDALSPEGYAYGIRQHEDLSLNHPNGGENKFLEKPMHTASGKVAAAAAELIRAVFRA